MITTYYQNTMPWKIVLTHKQSNKTETYYKSTTEYLSFITENFYVQIYQSNTN